MENFGYFGYLCATFSYGEIWEKSSFTQQHGQNKDDAHKKSRCVESMNIACKLHCLFSF